MKTQYVQSTDGIQLAYDLCGSGSGLLLLHGLPQGRQHWHDPGYVERLRHFFTESRAGKPR